MVPQDFVLVGRGEPCGWCSSEIVIIGNACLFLPIGATLFAYRRKTYCL